VACPAPCRPWQAEPSFPCLGSLSAPVDRGKEPRVMAGSRGVTAGLQDFGQAAESEVGGEGRCEGERK